MAPFSEKIRRFLSGRKGLFEKLQNFKQKESESPIWFHVASYGEYEQAKPVIAELKVRFPNLPVVVSFFSPSGFEPTSKKDQANVDFVTYLPIDTQRNAQKFVSILQPKLAFFVKYDLWFEHIRELKSNSIPIFLISALFRPTHRYFKKDGFFRKLLFDFDHIFTQNIESGELLQGIGYTSFTITGDTRFDRVFQNAENPKPLESIANWLDQKETIVLGSVWEEDMDILIPLINANRKVRWIIAPHDLDREKMRVWAKRIKQSSAFYTHGLKQKAFNVLFLDTIGMLSSVYQFAKIAYVGGAFGSGLHNILEPIGFGVPVIFGKIRLSSKFPEGQISQSNGCGFEVADFGELEKVFENLNEDRTYKEAKTNAQKWLSDNLGASKKICDTIELILQDER